MSLLRPVHVVEKPKFFEGDRLVSGRPSGLANPSKQIYIVISITYVFAVLFGLARHFGTDQARQDRHFCG
jgi:hypothetical protein